MNTLLEENKSLKKEIKSVKSDKTSFGETCYKIMRSVNYFLLVDFLTLLQNIVISRSRFI